MITGLVSDLHITGKSNETHATLDEQRDALDWIGIHAADVGVHVMLIGGDVYDAASTAAERNVAMRAFMHWSNELGLMVLGVRGNHDVLGETEVFNYINGVRFYESPATQFEEGEIFVVHFLPWPEKVRLVAGLGLTSRTEIDAAAAKAMRDILGGFRIESEKADVPVILLSHAEVGTAVADSGQPMTGKCDIELSEGDLLDCGADVVCLGHIHKRQTIGDGRIIYPGSYRPTKWGEPGPKGYCLIEVERGEKPVVEFVEVPHRPMVTVEAYWDKGELLVGDDAGIETAKIPDGADVRIKYKVDESAQHAAATAAAEIKAKWLDGGARAVKPAPEVVPTTRIRSEAIRKARTTEDRVRAWWEVNDAVPAREKEILEKLGQLESEEI